MKVILTHIKIELSKQDYITLKAEAQHVSCSFSETDKFDAEGMMQLFQIGEGERLSLLLEVSQFTRLKTKLKAALDRQEYQKQMHSAYWREFQKCINQIKY